MSDCQPVHEGPFFIADGGKTRCEACGRTVSAQAVRSAAFDYLGGDQRQAEQIEQSRARIER